MEVLRKSITIMHLDALVFLESFLVFDLKRSRKINVTNSVQKKSYCALCWINSSYAGDTELHPINKVWVFTYLDKQTFDLLRNAQ